MKEGLCPKNTQNCMPVGRGQIILRLFLGAIKVGKWGLFPFNPSLGGDFDHGKIMGQFCQGIILTKSDSLFAGLLKRYMLPI